MASDEIPILPEDASFSYVNEGAANIVYRIILPRPTPEGSLLDEYGEGTPPPSEIGPEIGSSGDKFEKLQVFDNKLLRLRKDLPTTLPVASNHEAWQRLIKPLFDTDDIVHQSLVRLSSGVLDKLNAELRQREEGSTEGDHHGPDFRPTKRHGTYLADEEFGLLVTDMTPDGYNGEQVMEFKPKWLAQSPSAPKNSVRCRQCARAARLNAELARRGEALQEFFCPLDLIENEDETLRATEVIAHSKLDHEYYTFALWVRNNILLEGLRDLQMMLDPIGVLENDKNNEKFRAAMTLRDCTVFVRITPIGEVEDEDDKDYDIEARIGDLDLKSPDKAEYWKETERALIDEGWYTGTERIEDQQPMTCLFSPNRDGDTMARSFPIIGS